MGKPRRVLNAAGELQCPKCRKYMRPMGNFYWDNARGDWHSYCIDCHKAKQSEYRERRKSRRIEERERLAILTETELQTAFAEPLGPPTGNEPHEEPCDDHNCIGWRQWAIRMMSRPL